MKTFTFNGVNSKEFFLVNKISRSILPPITRETRTLPQRHGAIHYRSNLGVTEISIDVTFFGESFSNLRSVVRDIAFNFYTEEPKELFFSDEPDLYYNAILSGSTDIEQIIDFGQGSLTFVAFDPFAYSREEKNISLISRKDTIQNNGTFEVFPKVKVRPLGETNTISVTKSKTGERIILQKEKQGDTFPTNKTIVVDTDRNFAFYEDTKESLMKFIHLDTEFFPLDVGENEISVLGGKGNIIPSTTNVVDFHDWYGTSELTSTQWKDGTNAVRLTMVDADTNPRIRLTTSSGNRGFLQGGVEYVFSFVIKATEPFRRLEFNSLIHYHADGSGYDWVIFDPAYLEKLTPYPYENNAYIYETTFVADHDGEFRISLGFGLGQEVKNGDGFEVGQVIVQPTEETETSFSFTERFL